MEFNLDFINSNIENREPFAFTRWGDGEWYNVNKLKGQNCDGNTYFEDLGEELKKIVMVEQDYYLGVQTLIEYSLSNSKLYPQKWVDADIFHKSSIIGVLGKFIERLEKNHVVYIGNKSLKQLKFVDEFIEISLVDSWLHKNEILNNIRNTFDTKHKLYLFSAGMATNVYIDILWKENNNNTYIDIGSVFDPYVGKSTRRYHKKLNINI